MNADRSVADDPDATATEDTTERQLDAEGHRFELVLGTTAVVAVLFLMLRLLAVARWDWGTVAEIADTFDFSDSFAIAFGTVAVQPWITGIFTAILLPLVLMRIFWPTHDGPHRIEISQILAAVVLTVIAFAMTVTYRNLWTILGVLGVGALAVAIRLFSRGRLRRWSTTVLSQLAAIALIGVVLLAVLDDVPWMSEEEITTTSGPITGYVLEEAPGFLHVLTADRDVLIIPTSHVRARKTLD